VLRLPPFDYRAAASYDEAVALLAVPGSRAVAGGHAAVRPASSGNGGLSVTIGAGTRLERVAASADVRLVATALAEAAASVGNPTLRRMGTVGGNLCQETRCTSYDRTEFWRTALGGCLKIDGDRCRVAPGSVRCWAVCASDLAPTVVALGANLGVHGVTGEREIAAADLYRGDGITPLGLDSCDVLTYLRVPAEPTLGSAYLKLRPRASFDYPSLGVAVAVRREGDRVAEIRVALGAVAPGPVSVDVGEALVGRAPSTENLEEAARRVTEAASPVANADFSPAYRKKMAAVYFRRAFARAWERTVD
jgi:4-hydroxybenzoyl-CoA reductase subunit beta